MRSELKLSPPPHKVGECCVQRCRAESAYTLGVDTSYFDVEEELGICEPHWDKLCEDPPKAAAVAIAKMAAKKKAPEPEPVEELEEDELEDEEDEAPPPNKRRRR